MFTVRCEATRRQTQIVEQMQKSDACKGYSQKVYKMADMHGSEAIQKPSLRRRLSRLALTRTRTATRPRLSPSFSISASQQGTLQVARTSLSKALASTMQRLMSRLTERHALSLDTCKTNSTARSSQKQLYQSLTYPPWVSTASEEASGIKMLAIGERQHQQCNH